MEVWQTVRAALEVLWASQRATEDEEDENGGAGEDVALATAQTILTAAGVTLPTGNLIDGVYDDLGNWYQLPEYVVADPVDVAAANEEEEGTEEETKDVVVTGDGMKDEEEEEARRRREEKGKSVVDRRAQVSVVIRLSDGAKDLKLHVGKDEAVRSVVRTVREETGVSTCFLPGWREPREVPKLTSVIAASIHYSHPTGLLWQDSAGERLLARPGLDKGPCPERFHLYTAKLKKRWGH